MSDRTWERRKGESARAYAAFVTYRDLGHERSLAMAAAELGRHVSLLKRWSARYQWRDRVWAWEAAEARAAEEAIRQQREEAARRQARDAGQLQRLAMARLAGCIRRDPETGEVMLDDRVRPRDAVAIYRWGVELEDRITGRGDTAETDDPTEQQLKCMTTDQLRDLLALARERAGDADEEETDAD